MALAVSGELLELVLCALRVVGHGLSDVGEEDPPRLTESRRLVALGAGDSGERVEGFSPNISTQPFCSHGQRQHDAGDLVPKRETPPERGFREVGGTGLEPVTPSLSS